jgi:hypothetical protein
MGRETPNTCYDAGTTIIAPILQCVSAAPPTQVHHRLRDIAGALVWLEQSRGRQVNINSAERKQEMSHSDFWRVNSCKMPSADFPNWRRLFYAGRTAALSRGVLRKKVNNVGHCITLGVRSMVARDSFFLRVSIGSGATPVPLSPARNPTGPPN